MTKYQSAFFFVGLVLCSPLAAQAKGEDKPPKPAILAAQSLSLEDKQHLLQDTFTIVKTVSEIPVSVQKVLIPGRKDALNGMADPGQKYQETDVVGGTHLSFRRLIFAANSPQYCLVYSEHGGIAYWQSLSLFRLTAGQATQVWEGEVMKGEFHALDFAEICSQIRAGKYYASQPSKTRQ